MINDLLGWGSLASQLPYGHEWRTSRRAFWQEFNPKCSSNHQPNQLRYARDLLRRLLDEPDEFLHHIDYTLAAAIISTTYDLDVRPMDDPNIQRANKALAQLPDAGISGTYMVDILPFLKYIPSWVPGAGFKAYAERARLDTMAMREVPFEQGCSKLREGHGKPSVLSRSLGRGGYSIDGHTNKELLKDVAWLAYTGGAETSHIALSTFVAAMLLYPDVQRKGQDDIDTYLGSRLPVFDDLPSLPYVHAIIIFPLGVPHRLTMDDEYKGYFIPKGTTILVNTWALLRDGQYYPEPDTFDPERFLQDGKINPKLLDHMPNFGFGRRKCPGRFFAMDSLLICIASTLSCFDIAKAKDGEGRYIEPEIRYSPGFSRSIIPFECSITPRSAEAVKLIRNAESM